MNNRLMKVFKEYASKYVLFPDQNPTAHISHLVQYLRNNGFEIKEVGDGQKDYQTYERPAHDNHNL